MPFKSQAQRRKFAELLVQGKISPETYEEWNRETGGREAVSHNEAALTAVRDRRHSQRSAVSGSTLVALQAAAALVLLLAAAVAIRSARAIGAIDLGFEPRQLITLNASAVDASGPQQRQFSHDLLTAVRALPGVTAAAAVSLRPLQGLIGNDMSFLVDGQRPFPALDGAKNPIVVYEAITPEYFRTMGASILRGRDFTEDDKGDRMPVVIVRPRRTRGSPTRARARPAPWRRSAPGGRQRRTRSVGDRSARSRHRSISSRAAPPRRTRAPTSMPSRPSCDVTDGRARHPHGIRPSTRRHVRPSRRRRHRNGVHTTSVAACSSAPGRANPSDRDR
jgi:hypothetical protein